jgi:hypothetical protein
MRVAPFRFMLEVKTPEPGTAVIPVRNGRLKTPLAPGTIVLRDPAAAPESPRRTSNRMPQRHASLCPLT